MESPRSYPYFCNPEFGKQLLLLQTLDRLASPPPTPRQLEKIPAYYLQSVVTDPDLQGKTKKEPETETQTERDRERVHETGPDGN
jgi:hypothetical protein